MIQVPKKIKGIERPADSKRKNKAKNKTDKIGYGDPFGNKGQFRGTSLQVR